MSWKENGVLFRTWTQSKTWHTEAELLNGREREKREGLFCVCLLVEKVFVANGANNNWGLRNLTVRFQNFQNFSLAGSPISITPKSQLHPSSCNNLLAFSLSLSLSTLHVFPERNIASYLLSILQLPHTLTLPCFQYFHSLTLILFLHIVFSISTRFEILPYCNFDFLSVCFFMFNYFFSNTLDQKKCIHQNFLNMFVYSKS